MGLYIWQRTYYRTVEWYPPLMGEQIAAMLGVAQQTIGRDLAGPNGPLSHIQADGKDVAEAARAKEEG